MITGSSHSDIDKFKEDTKSMFWMSDLRLLKYYLGLEVVQSEEGITLCQRWYAAMILEGAGLVNCKPSNTPMEGQMKLSKWSTALNTKALWDLYATW